MAAASYDAVIIGSGAGGGTLARYLAEHGKNVLVIERGGYVERGPANWDAGEVFERARYSAGETWLDKNGKPFRPGEFYNVGGKTKFYGAALYRLRPSDFESHPTRDGWTQPWPIRYEDMKASYFLAERMYHVHGGDGSSPFPALPHDPVIQRVATAFGRSGLNPESAPVGVMLDSSRDSRCVRCDSCDGFACPLLAKADAETCGIIPALATGRVTLLTGTQVTRLVRSDFSHEIEWIETYGPDGTGSIATHGIPVILAAGAVNSAALWLRSVIPDYSQQAGRNYMCHVSSAVLATGHDVIPRGFHKTLMVNDFYHHGVCENTTPLGQIQMAGQPQAAMLRGESWAARLGPGVVLRDVAARSVTFWLMTEDLPRGDNRVTVDDDGRVKLSVRHQYNRGAHRDLYRELSWRLDDAGFPFHLRKEMGIGAVAHQCGTLRMSETVNGGPVNRDGRAWDTGNLYVGDASVFPSSGAVNPALTVMALALRLGEHLTGGRP